MAPIALMEIKLATCQEQQSKVIKLAPKVRRADQTWEKLHVKAQQLSNRETGQRELIPLLRLWIIYVFPQIFSGKLLSGASKGHASVALRPSSSVLRLGTQEVDQCADSY